jgi:hypothetical protein
MQSRWQVEVEVAKTLASRTCCRQGRTPNWRFAPDHAPPNDCRPGQSPGPNLASRPPSSPISLAVGITALYPTNLFALVSHNRQVVNGLVAFARHAPQATSFASSTAPGGLRCGNLGLWPAETRLLRLRRRRARPQPAPADGRTLGDRHRSCPQNCRKAV